MSVATFWLKNSLKETFSSGLAADGLQVCIAAACLWWRRPRLFVGAVVAANPPVANCLFPHLCVVRNRKVFSMEFAFFMLFASVRQSAPTNPLTHAPAPTPATARAPAHTRNHPHATARPQPCTCAPRAQESLIDIESMKVRCAWVVLHKRLLLLLCTCFFGYLLPITRQPRFLLCTSAGARTPSEWRTDTLRWRH